jgi:antitoxin ParD1/3/4
MVNHNPAPATMSISLPAELKDYVQKRTKQAHFGTPSDYIRGLIREDLKREEQARLEQELLKGIRSGNPIEMTSQKYEDLRQDLRARAEKNQ